MHKDSGGHTSVISAGGVQWMTAGRGLVHAEISSDDFKRQGGPLEILQLWINLPSRFKMTEPKYTGLQKKDIPVVQHDHGRVTINAVAGSWSGTQGAVQPLDDVALASIEMKKDGRLKLPIPQEKNVLFYVVEGSVNVNGSEAKKHHLVEFENDDEQLQIRAASDAVLLLGYATPFNEPFVAYGPFVMNTREEITQAYEDFSKGNFGSAQL